MIRSVIERSDRNESMSPRWHQWSACESHSCLKSSPFVYNTQDESLEHEKSSTRHTSTG
ncbi:hypothetical protein J6590_104072 [Homalodisca vitripennis]|nr:hypothetical protein J6590_104072 [Homalodisca vitripennis]